MTASERIVSSSSSKVPMMASGFVFRILSPSWGPAHWKSWAGAVASSMLDPVRKTFHRRTKIFHSSVEIPTSIFGRSSDGARTFGAGAVTATAG